MTDKSISTEGMGAPPPTWQGVGVVTNPPKPDEEPEPESE